MENRRLVVSREYPAPKAVVFRAWTDAGRFARWFGPRNVAVPFCRLDAVPGGLIHFCHRLPDGRTLWVQGHYVEVTSPDRLRFRVGFVDADGMPARHPMVPDWPLDAFIETTVIFSELDPDWTRVLVRQEVLPEDIAGSEPVSRERAMAQDGWQETLDRLAEELSMELVATGD